MKKLLTLLIATLAAGQSTPTAFVGARLIDGSGKPAVENATLVVRDGRIEKAGRGGKPAAGGKTINVAGKTIIPGLISANSHVANEAQLGRYARYGVTAVMSLGGDREIEIRDKMSKTDVHARLFIAGPVIASRTPEDARKLVDEIAAAKTDIVKFRLDDNLGAGQKMAPEVYGAIFDEAKKKGMRVAVHVVTLADAKAVLRLGAAMIAHSVRDQEIDDEMIALLKKTGAVYCPTFTREISTYIFPEKPAFLSDPFLLKDADPAELSRVRDAAFLDRMSKDKAGQWYKEHLPVALRNLKKVSDAGLPVVMGTDTGPPARFQGFFEHLELEYMIQAGLTPMQIIVSATSSAARFLHAADLGTLAPGKQADFVVLGGNPLDDIKNTRQIESVWIGGKKVQ